jgi:hypothetical protein
MILSSAKPVQALLSVLGEGILAVGQYKLAGTPGAKSDHAALMCDVSVSLGTPPASA